MQTSWLRTTEEAASDLATTSWYPLDPLEIARRLETSIASGLDSEVVPSRRARFGTNELPELRREGPLRLFLRQFQDFMIAILLAAAVTAGIVGDPKDAIAILVIVLLNALVGAVQQFRADRAIAALRKLTEPCARVVRNGQELDLPAVELVPGDVALIAAGDLVPADLRLVEVADLRLDESLLTGESAGTQKQCEALAEPSLAIAEQTNMAFRGTLVTNGRGRGVVVATGSGSELGSIALLLQAQRRAATPLQARLARFGRALGLTVLAICALIFVSGLLRGEPPLLMFLTAVSLAVAAIPEALPAIVTVALALGAKQMSRHRALIRNLPAVETLGSVSTICSDKTGTLTQNRMRAEQFQIGAQPTSALRGAETSIAGLRLQEALALSNDVRSDAIGGLRGDPTEIALYRSAVDAGVPVEEWRRQLPRVAEIPFDSTRKCMTTLHTSQPGVTRVFCKGSPERVLPLCSHSIGSTGRGGPIDRDAWLRAADELAHAGYRVLAFASRELPQVAVPVDAARIECELGFAGLVGLIDPPREEARAAVEECIAAGIVPVMITGDHPGTASAIAHRVGILRETDEVLSGPEIARLSQAELVQHTQTARVFARVSPEQKIAIVEAFQAGGNFVAMTGDGVNDGPALKRANIGVAMGDKGTDVARAAADMVLLDDNFATIVRAVREGRRIFDNVRKFIRYTMTSNAGEIWTLFLAPFMGLPIPLLPIHILWINLVTDGLPGLAFSAEPAETDLMRRPPRPPNESIFAHGMWQQILWVGLMIGALSIGSQAWAISRNAAYWQTVVFTVLTFSQLFNALGTRSQSASLFRLGVTSNRPMLGALLATAGLQLAVIYWAPLQKLFSTRALPLFDLACCLAASSLVLAALEVEKWLVRNKRLYTPEATAQRNAQASN